MPDDALNDETVMNLVELALARPAGDREVYIRNACGQKTDLFSQVWEYVQWEERMNGFLLESLYPDVPGEPAFEPGDLLDGRFRILREVSQGGMGIVYEATDERLDRRVAVKCAKTGFNKRLPPEVRAASAISHPNVCRIFEIHTTSTPLGDIDFFTMEFLEGETLAARVRRGPLPQAEARAIALQLSAGLAEAHRNGVVHGDLKSSNVILATGPEGTTRAVITDFGLARRPNSAPPAAQAEMQGGTPNYMAPELWKGDQVSPASDVYALGVILYELIAGRQPWPADTPWQDRPTLRPQALGSGWDRVLDRCLNPDPRKRYQEAQEVERALAPGNSRLWIAAGVAAAVLAAVTGVVTHRSSVPRDAVQLAMVPFQSDPADARAAADLFRATNSSLMKLRGNDRISVTVIPASRIEAKRVGTPERARAVLGATHALWVTIAGQNGSIAVDARLIDLRKQVDVKEWKAEFAPDELHFAPAALTGVVSGALHLPHESNEGTVNAAARQDYQEGIAAVRFDSRADDAMAHLQRAVQADPDSPLTRARLAEAEWFRFFVTKNQQWLTEATESARKAELRDPDSATVLRVKGILDANAGRYEDAEAKYRRAIELEPANSDAHRRLGMVLAQHGHPDEALAEYQSALKADPSYHRTYQEIGTFYIALVNYAEAIRYLTRTVQLAPGEANAHYALGVAYMDPGQFSDAEKELTASVGLRETATALGALGEVLLYEGKDREAVPDITRAIQVGPESYQLWFNLGVAYRHLRQQAESTRANRRGLELAEKVMARDPRNGRVRAQLAVLCAALGDRSRAESEIVQALQLSPDNADARWAAAVAYETLRDRDKTIDVLESAPAGVLADLNHWPDVADLHKDPRFLKLLASHQIK